MRESGWKMALEWQRRTGDKYMSNQRPGSDGTACYSGQ